MKEITSEYIQILNDYIKVEESGGKVIETKLIDAKELSIVLDSFWTTEYDKLIKKIESFDGIKTLNHGIIPENLEVYLKRSSLYSDLIIFEAPLDAPTLISNFKSKNDTKRLLRVIGYKLSKLNKIKDWIDEGIVTLVPSPTFQERAYRNYSQTLAEDDLKDDNIINVLDNFYAEVCKMDSNYIKTNKHLNFMGAVSQLNGNLMTTGILDAILTADNEFYWKLLTCKLEKDGKICGKESINFAALNKVNVKFLENVTLDFALKLREEGSLSELRSYFRETFKDIQKTPDKSEFFDLVQNYSFEINDHVKMHDREWKNIKKDAFEKIGVKGSLAISSGAIGGITTFGMGIPAWVGFLGGVLATSNYTIRDIVDEFVEFRRNRKDLQRNPIHLLYELKTA